VDATITACAASDIFTQDLEDILPQEETKPAADQQTTGGAEAAPAEKPSQSKNKPAEKATTAKPTTSTKAKAGPMTFQQFIALINESVPSNARAAWMQKAQGGKDPNLLGQLTAEIRAAYPQGKDTPTGSPEEQRIAVMEYINTIVPEPDRPSLRADLEKIADDELGLALQQLKDRYEL
jgi:hypothetical protein